MCVAWLGMFHGRIQEGTLGEDPLGKSQVAIGFL